MRTDTLGRTHESRQAAAELMLPSERYMQVIDKSHRRSQAYGVAIHDTPDYSGMAKTHFNDVLDESRFLFQHAAPVMETLYEQIANTHSMVLLTSSKGLILHTLGDNDFLEKASRVALTPGIDWSEKTKGTNAIGTALSEEEPLTVHGSQHYMNANKTLTCSCAPIIDPYGQVIGALDVTGDHRSFHQHTLALVRMSAQMIENHMFTDSFPKAVRIHFHSRSEFLGTLVEGIAVFTPEGRFISANRSAQFQLGLSVNALKAHTFSSLFDLPLSSLMESFRSATPTPRQMCMHNGVSVWCRAEIKASNIWTHPVLPDISPAIVTTTPAASPPRSGTPQKQCPVTLNHLDTGDAQMSAIFHKLRKVTDRDIPVMILGETGTGKDLLAQAIHNDSARAGQPFIPLNCASIPDTLIEAELFGYEDGAFTGAKKKGSIGKILQANGGTLFLDEIGDMPKHLQARLLRVLQERKVSPLGAGKEVEVDVTVICATHKNLKEMMSRGEFREDLYYRLNGLVVRLPALRERTDFESVVRNLMGMLAQGRPVAGISEQVMRLLQGYHWPGNVRQLHNLLRTAMVMADDGGDIEVSHLPDDFLEELSTPRPASSASTAPEPLLPAPTAFAAAEETGPDGQRLQDVTLNAMAQMLRTHKGNVSAAAKALGVSRNTIYRKKGLLPPNFLD